MRLIAATNDTEYGRTEIGTSMRTASMIVHRKPLKFESDPHLRKRGLKMPFRLAVTASDRLPLALVCRIRGAKELEHRGALADGGGLGYYCGDW
ncbi:hypothetical protein EVAR_37118_1 [Eumeta japonica]|uniref:Uncharacterized protein n=1 Tax=Eumeta variegata TaxID=151549 RepID=A0A4C1XQ32_EUMVA|nr:hypothetical protein EVAR_37118_1 [Eumeta japonica]